MSWTINKWAADFFFARSNCTTERSRYLTCLNFIVTQCELNAKSKSGSTLFLQLLGSLLVRLVVSPS